MTVHRTNPATDLHASLPRRLRLRDRLHHAVAIDLHPEASGTFLKRDVLPLVRLLGRVRHLVRLLRLGQRQLALLLPRILLQRIVHFREPRQRLLQTHLRQ